MGRRLTEKSRPKRSENLTETLLHEHASGVGEAKQVKEGDMPNLLIESNPVQLTLTEAAGGRVVARGEFGRVGVPTQNGRIYPESLMLREIKRLSEDLSNRRVLGELDHPCLTSDDFRVLTVDGWKAFSDIKIGDRVWSRKDGEAVLSEVTGITDEPYDGPAYRVHGRSIDATFTPAHKFMLVKRPDRNGMKSEELVTLAEIAEHSERFAHHAVPKTAQFFAETISQVTIPGVEAKRLASCKNDVSQPLNLDADLFAAFLGIYLAEGNCSANSADNYDVCITQKTPWSKQFIYDEVLSKFPDGLEWREIETGYALADQRLYTYLKALGDVYTKRMPDEVKRLSADSLRELLFWFCIGDGRMVASSAAKKTEMARDGQTVKESMAKELRSGPIPFTRQDVFSVSEGLVRDLHECLVRAGGAGSITRIDPDKDYEYAGHIIRAEDKVPLYQLHICQSANVWMDPRYLAIDPVHHEGRIYCLSTTHGSFYMEREGNAFWTGNSDGKTSLKRVSHVITGLKIKDGIVVGEAEILNTPEGKTLKALIESNVQIGISSRGFGSTKPSHDPKTEGEIVQDDFVLKTWDFVADPAMKTAVPGIFTEDVDENQPDIAQLFLDEFPEIASSLQEDAIDKAKLKVSKGVDEAVKEAEERVRRELSEAFEKQLVSVMVEAKEDISNELREEYASDPDLGGAKAILSAIWEMVAPFHATDDEKAKADAEKARELEVSEAKAKAEDNEKRAVHAECMEHIEREIGGHPMADSIRKLVKKHEFVDLEDAKDKLAAILSDLPDRVNEGYVSEEDAAVREENAALKEKNSLLSERVDALNVKLKKAVELGTEVDTQREDAEIRVQEAEEAKASALEEAEEAKRKLDLAVYKYDKVVGLANGRELLGLMEDVSSEAVVDKLVSEKGVGSVSERELADARRKLQRGSGERNEAEELNEDKESRSSGRKTDDLGNDMSFMKRLAGLSNLD